MRALVSAFTITHFCVYIGSETTESMKTKLSTLLGRVNVVGVIASKADMKIAISNPDVADIFEWRVDCVYGPEIEVGLRELNRPIILTVRDAKEGGKQPSWDTGSRHALYGRYMNIATFIDIEASTCGYFHDLISYAKEEMKLGVIISLHDFNSVSSASMFKKSLGKLLDVGGDILKIAVTPQTLQDLCWLFNIVSDLEGAYGVKIVSMAMGKFGKISRLLAGLNGSPLVYGYLGKKAHVSGQWGVSEIKEMLARIK